MKFVNTLKIPFYFADAAGILFFSRAGEIFHQSYEKWWQEGFLWEEIFSSKKIAIPLVHWEVDYLKVLKAGSEIKVQLQVVKIGETSFDILCSVYEKQILAFQARSSHVFIDKTQNKKIKIPKLYRDFLAKYQS